MTSQKTPFLMAVVVAIFGLFWAQIAAPTQLKPLTNHLLDYPHAIPALVFERGIYRANVSHSHPVATMPTKLKAWLNSYLPKPLEIMCTTNDERGFCGGVNERQARYGGYAGGGTGSNSNAFIGSDAEKAGQLAAIIASNKGASIEVIKNAIKAAGLEVPAVIPTKTTPTTATPTTTAPTQSAAYIAQYGTEVGRYGYVYADGSVAGTTKVADGSLRVLALGDTQSAAARNSQVVASQVSAMSDQEILKSTGSSCTTNCQDAVSAAVTTILANSAVFDTAVKAEIIATQQQNSQAQEAYQAKIQAFLSPTTDLKSLAGCDPAHPGECRDLTAESYLRGLVTDSATLHELLSTRDTNIANYKKDLELVARYADASISDKQLAADICHNDFQCITRMNRDTYLANNLVNKSLAAQAKQQLAQNQMVAKYLTTTSAQLSQEYCRGVSSDRCKYLLDGGLLKDIGISAEKALELNRQKQANYAISRYELGQTGNITSTTIDTQAIYQTEYLACMTNTQGRGDCEAIANQQTQKKLSQAAPVNYQTEYDLAFKTCRSSPANSIDQCQQYAQKTATKLTNNSQTGATYVPQLEELYLASACQALGGANCNNVDESLTSLSAYTNDPEITLINIQNQKNKIYQNSMSQERIAFTLQNNDPANYDRLASDPNTDWVAQETALNELRQDFGTNIVLGWNNFTAGRFKRGNDLLMSQYQDCTGNTLWSCTKIDDYSRLTMLQGGIIQGGDAAFVITAGVAAALPTAGAVITGLGGTIAANSALGVGASGFLGTGFGIASSTQMIGTATDACTQAPGSEACHTAIAIATISVAGTGLGLASSLVGVAEAGATLSLAQKAIVAGNIGTEFLGAVTFGKMAYEACGENSTSLDCTSGILMAAASFGKLASTNFGLVAKLRQIEGKLGTVALTGGSALQGIHTASAITFGISACSKLFEGPANIDTMSMCAMGISGAVQDPLVAKLTGPKTPAPVTPNTAAGERIASAAELSQLKLAEAKAEVTRWQKVVDGTSGKTQQQARESLALAQSAHDALTPKAPVAPPPTQSDPIIPAKPKTVIERISETLFGKPKETVKIVDRKIELNEKYKEVVETLGSAQEKTGTKVFDKNGGSILVAETTKTTAGKEVTTFKFNEKIAEHAGLTDQHLTVLNEVLGEYQGQFEKQLGFDPNLGIRGQQAEYIISGLEAFGKNGTTGSLFGALPGLGKTEVIIPMMNYLHASMTRDAQFILFPDAKLMSPWISIDGTGKNVRNTELISFFDNKFGEGSVLILEPGKPLPVESVIKKARIVVTTRDAAFDLQNVETLGGKALRAKWAESYKFVDESHKTTNVFELFRRSSATEKISQITDANIFKDAIKSVQEFSAIKEAINARKSGQPLDVSLTSDGKSGEYSTARETKVINELLAKNKDILPENLKNRSVNEENLVETRSLIDQFVDGSYRKTPAHKQFAAELTIVNKLADLLAAVPGKNYGLAKTNGEFSVAPKESSNFTGRTYSSLAEQLLYNTVGVEILKGVKEIPPNTKINLDNLTVSRGGSETTYARLMLEGKGFAMFTGTPELMSKLYKIAYGIELKVFSKPAFETLSERFIASTENGIFTSITDQFIARVNESVSKRSQVYVFMDKTSNNVATLDKLTSNFREGETVFGVKANGEMIQGVVENGKFRQTKSFNTKAELELAQNKVKIYKKFYEDGAITGVDTPNDVATGRVVGICSGCDQTTISQGIARFRPSAQGENAPMDIIYLDAPSSLKNASKGELFLDLTKSSGINEATNMAIAEVNFKEILLKTSVDLTIERVLAQTKDGFIGSLLDGGLRSKVEAIQKEWKNINEYSWRLENADYTPEQKLAKTLKQVKGIMESLDLAIGKNTLARAEFNASAGGYKDLSIGFKDVLTVKPLSDKPSLADIVELINNTSGELKKSTITFKERGATQETILASAQEAVANATTPSLLSRLTTTIKSWLSPRNTAIQATQIDTSLTPGTRAQLLSSTNLIQTGLSLIPRALVSQTPAQQALTLAQNKLSAIQNSLNLDNYVSKEDQVNAQAAVQQAEFLVKNGYPLTLPILDNETVLDILNTPGSEMGFYQKDGEVLEFRNIDGQITVTEKGSVRDVTLLEALSLLPQPGTIDLATRGTQNLDRTDYRLSPPLASTHSTFLTATTFGTKLAGQITNTLDTASPLTPQSPAEVSTPKTSINNLLFPPMKANKTYARARSTIIKKISRVINSRRSYPYYDPLKMKKTISPEGKIFIEKYVNPNIPDHTISETATYLLENLANLAPINPSVYWELFYQLSFTDKKAVANRFVSRDLLKNMDLINFINNPGNKKHFYQLLDYVWDYADETRLSDNIINNTRYAIRSSELHNYFIGMNNYYESTKLDFDQIRIIALQNSLNTTIPLVPPPFLTGNRLQLYQEQAKIIEEIHQLVLTDNPGAIQKIREYLDKIDPNVTKQIEQVINLLSKNEFNDLTNSYTTQNKGINRMNIPGFDQVALPYTWAVFAEEVIANNLMRQLIPPIALNNIFKMQNEAMANFWTKIVPSLGIELPDDFRGSSLRADDVYFIFSDKKYHNAKADAGGMIALLNYSNPVTLILSLHHEANHQYIPSNTYTEIAVELLAQIIDYQGKNLLPPVNYSNSSYQDGVNELLSLITELNDEYSLTDKDYGTKLFIRSLVASAKDSDIDPLQLFKDEYGKIFPNKESIHDRLALYTDDVYNGATPVPTDINSTNTSPPSIARLSGTPKKAVELDSVRQKILTVASRAGQSFAQAIKSLLSSNPPPGVSKYAEIILDENGVGIYGIEQNVTAKYGTNGKVVQGIDLKTHTKVAIKRRLSTLDLNYDSQSVNRYQENIDNEGDILTRLDQQNIPKLLYKGTDQNGLTFLVTPWIDDLSLDKQIKTKPLSPQKTISVITPIALALDHAHSHGIVHKDVQAINILGHTLIDWGKGLIESRSTPQLFELSKSLDLTKLATTIYHALTGEETAGNIYSGYKSLNNFDHLKSQLSKDQIEHLDNYFSGIFSSTTKYSSATELVNDFSKIITPLSPSTDCSFCSVRIDEALKRASGNTARAIRSALTYHNDHTFLPRGLFIQSTLNAALYERLGDLTSDRTYYDQALSHLSRAQTQLNDVKSDLEVGPEIINPDVTQFEETTQKLLLSLPISGTPKWDDSATFESNLAAVRTALETKRAVTKPSFWTRYLTHPLFSLYLSLNRTYGNLVGRGENDSQLLPEPIIHDQTTLQNKEEEYLKNKESKYTHIRSFYEDSSTSDAGYLKSMNNYIGTTKIKPAGQAKVTTQGLDQIRKNVKPEIDRLFNNKEKRKNPIKHAIITWQTNLYIDLLKQALEEGDLNKELTLSQIQLLVERNIHTLAYQDFVATENTLGDHGLRHLVEHNIRVAEQVLDLARSHFSLQYQVKAIDYLIAHQIMVDHDMGYATEAVRDGVNADATKGKDSGHNVLAAKIIRERTQGGTDPLSQVFGADGIARIHQGVLTHDSSSVDLTQSSSLAVESAIHLADNTHAFETKLPELLYSYPEAIVSLRLLKAAGETGDTQLFEEIKQNLANTILDREDIGEDDRLSLLKAIQTLNKDSYAFTVGRIMGKNLKLSFDQKEKKIVVPVQESGPHKDIVALFDRNSYDQLAKFIADIMGIKKSEALARLDNDEVNFKGDSVIIQAVIGEEFKDQDLSPYQKVVEELTKNDQDFVNYILEDKEQQNFLKDLGVKLKDAKDKPTSLSDIINSRSFKIITLALKNGETIVFTNLNGSLTYTKHSDEADTSVISKFVAPEDLEYYLRDLDIMTVNKDGTDLPSDSYTIQPTPLDPQVILDIEQKITNFKKYRSKLIRNYLTKKSSTTTSRTRDTNLPGLSIGSRIGNSILDLLQAPKPISDARKVRMIAKESSYLARQGGLLKRIYANPRSSYQIYEQKMQEYINPGPLAESKTLEEVHDRAYFEAQRLLGGQGKRNHPVKLKIMTNYIDLYLSKVKEAISSREISLTGKNGITIAEIQSLIIEEIDSLAYQDYMDSFNLLGEHGLRQLDYNIKTTFRLLDLAKSNGARITALDYLKALKIQSTYNLGLTNPLISAGINNGRYGVETGYPAISSKLLREQLEQNPKHPLAKLFPADLEFIHQSIVSDDDFAPNLNSSSVNDVINSAVYLSHMTNIFDANRLPELIFSQPSSLKTMRLLKSIGEIYDPTSLTYQTQVEKIKQMLIADINANSLLNPDDREAMIKAAKLLDPSQWTHNIGRIGGKTPTFSLDAYGTLHITAEVSSKYSKISQFFNQKGYVKLASLISKITGEKEEQVLVQMDNDVDRFGNDNIIIEAVKTPDEISSGKTDFQTAVDKILLQDQALSEYNRRDNLLAIGQKVAEEKLVEYPASSKANLKKIKKARITLLNEYLLSIPEPTTENATSPITARSPILTKFRINLIRNIVSVLHSLGFFNVLPAPLQETISIIQSNFSNLITWLEAIPPTTVRIYESFTSATITTKQSVVMKISEKNYIHTQIPNAPELFKLYQESESTFKDHQKEQKNYIKPVKLAKAKSHDELKNIAYSEAARLLGSKERRNNPAKLEQLKSYINLYLVKMKEANQLTVPEIQPLLIDNLHTILYQDSVDLENTLSDHGLSRITYNLNVATQILDLAKAAGTQIDAVDYLVAMEIVINQDVALTNKLLRDGINSGKYSLNKGRGALSALILREKLERTRNNPLGKLYTSDQINLIHQVILDNSHPSIDLNSTVPMIIKASIFVANTSNTTNPPELTIAYPKSIETMLLLKSIGEFLDPKSAKYRELSQKVKSDLVNQIMQDDTITKSDQSALVLAANQLNSSQWEYIVGRLGGEPPTFAYDGTTNILTINANISPAQDQVNQLFGRSDHPQIVKLIYDFTGLDQDIIRDRLARQVPEFKGDGFTLHLNYVNDQATADHTIISEAIKIYSQQDQQLAKNKPTYANVQKRIKLIEDFLHK